MLSAFYFHCAALVITTDYKYSSPCVGRYSIAFNDLKRYYMKITEQLSNLGKKMHSYNVNLIACKHFTTFCHSEISRKHFISHIVDRSDKRTENSTPHLYPIFQTENEWRNDGNRHAIFMNLGSHFITCKNVGEVVSMQLYGKLKLIRSTCQYSKAVLFENKTKSKIQSHSTQPTGCAQKTKHIFKTNQARSQ